MLEEVYVKEVMPKLKEELGRSNRFALPRLAKVIVHTGIGKIMSQKTVKEQEQVMDQICRDLAAICGQKPVVARAKKSISSFKLRKGMPSGLKVTLRRKKMFDFLERLLRVALPRSRDFRGIKRSAVDQSGNLTIGINEHTIFPEILPEESFQNFGMEVTVVTEGAKNSKEALRMFELMGFPLQKE